MWCVAPILAEDFRELQRPTIIAIVAVTRRQHEQSHKGQSMLLFDHG